jgi:hypothetical protein
MIRTLWEFEKVLDYGMPMDIVFVHNVPLPKYDVLDDYENYERCVEFLYSLDGRETKNGKVEVVERNNLGISFGAYDFAFRSFRHRYDYWLFVEDDKIVVRNGVLLTAVRQLESESERVGFVSICGIARRKRAIGGCGCSSREILEEVCDSNYSEYYHSGCLPHDVRVSCFKSRYKRVLRHAENPFSTQIVRNGYVLKPIEMSKVVVVWGRKIGNRLKIPWSEDLKPGWMLSEDSKDESE